MDNRISNKISNKILNLSYLLLFALLTITPLIFLKQIESTFDLAKKSSLIVLGGIFFIASCLYFLIKTYHNKDISVNVFNVNLYIDKKMDIALLLFLAAAFLSMVFSIKPYVSFYGQYTRQVGFVSYLYLFLVYFIGSQLFRDDNKRDAAIKVTVLTGAIVSFYAILQYYKLDPFGTPLITGTKPVSTLGHNVFLGGFLVIIFPFSLLGFIRKRNLLNVIFPMLTGLGILVSQCRAAYMAVFISALIILILYPFLYKSEDASKFKKLSVYIILTILFITAALVLLIILIPDNHFISRIISILDIESSARLLIWRDSFSAYKVHPFTGSGIATFSSVFEYFRSYELRMLEPKNYFDNAHNIFINTLVTMGAIGAAAYIFMIGTAWYISFKGFINSVIEKQDRLLFLAAVSSLTGFIVYGMADFEDSSILLYLFIVFAVVKSLFVKYYPSQLLFKSVKSKNSLIYVCAIFSVVVILTSGYYIYSTFNEQVADSYYKEANEFYTNGEFNNSVKKFNEAIIKNNTCGQYKFTLAYNVSDFCLKSPELDSNIKINLLNEAKEEAERSWQNYFSHLQYKALLSIINFQLGNIDEAEKLKKQVFKADTLLLNFRNNLARYYLANGKKSEMMNELNAVLSVDPYNSEATIISVLYYASIKDKISALRVCSNYLTKFPEDPFVKALKEKIESFP